MSMSSGDCRTGKIQYCQEKQGFIRCGSKIMGKRDIIFFVDEIPVYIRDRIRLGVRVLFRVESNSLKRNCKGVPVDHYAVIENVIDDNPMPLLGFKSCQSMELSDSSCLPHVLQKESSDVSYQLLSCAHTAVLRELLSTVYLDVYKKSSSYPSESSYKSCWEV